MKKTQISKNKNRYLLKTKFRYFPLSLWITVALLSGEWVKDAKANDYFSPNSLDKRGVQSIANIDSLSVFAQSEGQLPGTYMVDVYINNEPVGLNTIKFIANNSNQLLPELTKRQLIDWGLNPKASSEFSDLADDTVVTSLVEYISGASTKFDLPQQKLLLNIPQIAMKSTARGYVSPELWEQGITALTLNYGFTGSKTWQKNNEEQHANFLSLRSGINLSAWRLRNYSVYSQNNDGHHWENINTYLERDIARLKSQFTVGQTATSGNIFDSVQFTGVSLASDDSMLPYSLRGFAPVVRGIAQSNAKITVRQNGYIIYQTYVSPGPFEITDLYPTSASGNLDVSVEGMDGSERTFVVPFSSVPIMQREGQLKYSVVGGKYRAYSDQNKTPHFVQSTLIYGLPWDVTLYGGGLYSPDYQAAVLGSGLNLGDVGAFSFDVTNARTQFDVVVAESLYQGQSYRFQYAKSLLNSGTTLTLAGYRYSTEGYYDFAEANDYYQARTHFNKRSRVQANISQTLGSYGSLFINAYQQDFWGRQGQEKTLSAGYNANWGNITYGFNYIYSELPGNNSANQQFAFNMSLPFGALMPGSRITTSMSTDNSGMSNMQLGVSGQAIDNKLNYGVQQSYGNKGQQNSGSTSASYTGRNGTLNGGYSHSAHSQRVNYGLYGGLIVHEDGITVSQQLGETVALVRAPDANDVAIQGRTGITTNSQGYAVVPYLTPYQRNNVRLNVETLGEHVDLVNNSVSVVPTRGAVVWADFKTKVGWRALIKLTRNGTELPFGTIVVVENKNSSNSEALTGIVGEHGEVYLNGLPDTGSLHVKWGEGHDQQCWTNFVLPDNKQQPVLQLTATCSAA